jgi:hypothetical protein
MVNKQIYESYTNKWMFSYSHHRPFASAVTVKNVRTVANFTFNSLITCLLCTQDVPSFDFSLQTSFPDRGLQLFSLHSRTAPSKATLLEPQISYLEYVDQLSKFLENDSAPCSEWVTYLLKLLPHSFNSYTHYHSTLYVRDEYESAIQWTDTMLHTSSFRLYLLHNSLPLPATQHVRPLFPAQIILSPQPWSWWLPLRPCAS